MLSRANQVYKASAPQAQHAKTDLERQLFPSSSQSVRDGNIADSFNKGHDNAPSASSGSSKAAGNSPLQPRSNNSITQFVKPMKEFTSLYDKAGSFSEEPVHGTGRLQAKPKAPIFFAADDFSDDDTLELDYECPTALPRLPAAPKSTTAVRRTAGPSPIAPAKSTTAPSTSQISWSSSPREHFFPPQTLSRSMTKRESPDAAAPAPRPAKKRTLPVNWNKGQKREDPIDIDELESQSAEPFDTPAPSKPERSTTGIPTYSATKEKKKLLKHQSKKPESEAGLSVEEIRSITDAHMKAKVKVSSAISLSSEQEHVLKLVVDKKQSVFFTGPAGTGKSVLMRAIISALKKKWARDPERLSITASTGLAACNIGGQTLHSFAGIGLGKEDVPTLVRKIRRNAKAKNRWLRTSVLIIDEISMVDGELFDKLAQIARTIRNNGRPWGGIQLVITGDFFQLPPVPDRDKKRDTKFAFDAATWSTSIDHTIGLTQVFRQRDPEFANMLNEMRLGRISEQTVQSFKRLSRPLTFDDGLEVTELFPTRTEVERSNDMRLRNLPGPVRRFDAADSGEPNIRDKLLENMMAPKYIELKKGAQVMLIKNLDDTLVNGSLGKVRGFMSEATFELWGAQEEFGDEDSADESRSKQRLKSFSRDSSLKDMKEYPVVQFTGIDGGHRTMLMLPEDWKVELPNGEVQAQRRQLPLILAWALSIHKAQGQTLERVKVDLGRVFEKGQAYVALSRATSKQGLQVLKFDKGKVMAHPRVVQFYDQLYSAESAITKKKSSSTIADFTYSGRLDRSQSDSSVRKGVGVIKLDDDEEAMAASYMYG